MSTAVQTDRRTMRVRLLTPERPVFDDQAYMVVAPSVLGEVGLLPRHAPLIAFLKVGEVRVKMADDTVHVFATTTGFLSNEDDEVLIMVEQAEPVGDIDRARAEAALQRAEEGIASAGDDEVALHAAQAAKRRAENRIRVVEKHAGKSGASH